MWIDYSLLEKKSAEIGLKVWFFSSNSNSQMTREPHIISIPSIQQLETDTVITLP